VWAARKVRDDKRDEGGKLKAPTAFRLSKKRESHLREAVVQLGAKEKVAKTQGGGKSTTVGGESGC